MIYQSRAQELVAYLATVDGYVPDIIGKDLCNLVKSKVGGLQLIVSV